MRRIIRLLSEIRFQIRALRAYLQKVDRELDERYQRKVIGLEPEKESRE